VRRLTRLLMREYPECVPYGGEHPDPHPHLTVACGSPTDLDAIEQQVEQALRDRLPFTTVCDRLVVMEQQPTGRWRQAHDVGLGARDQPATGRQVVRSAPSSTRSAQFSESSVGS
jgi:hypothetical protein